jgi:hypothetical protein
MNTFANVPEFLSADFKAVVRPNFDTLYSIAWLDLTKEPMIVSVPDTDGRYYLLEMLDMWSDAFAAPGWRATGTRAGDFLVVPPGWQPDLREKFVEALKLPKETQRIETPTPYVWIIGHTKTDGPADYDAVHKIQAGFKITPLSRWGKKPVPVTVKIDKAIDMKTPPKLQVDRMPAGRFFAIAATLLKQQPPHLTDEPIIARLRRIGFEAGKDFDVDKLDPSIRNALARVPEDAQKLMQWKTPTIAEVVNGWSMNTNTMGVYGNYYLKRAIVAQLGLGANVPEDAIYPLNVGDETGKPMCSTLTKGRRPRWNHSGPSRSMIQTVFRSQMRSTALRSAAGCRSNTIPMVHSIFISRTRAQAPTKRPIGFQRQKGHLICPYVSMRRSAMC